MERYFILNLLLSLLCALALMALAKSPARLRFYVGITMLVSWLIPWHILHISLPHTMANSPLFALPQIDASNIAMPAINALNNTALQTNMQINWLTVSLDYLWLVVAAIGLSLFARDICRYRKLMRAWLANSRLDNALWQTLKHDNTAHAAQYPIRRIASQGPGMATGLLHPLIWIDETLQDTEQLSATVLHEVTHIKQNDPRWLWVICILQRLLWWNPIAWWASNYTKQQMELSCDETCQSQMPENSYQQLLIQIMLNQQTTIDKRVVNQPIASIRYGQKFNLKRVLILDEEIQMKKRHNTVIVGLFCLFGWIGLSNATGVVDKVLKNTPPKSTLMVASTPELDAFSTAIFGKEQNLALAEDILNPILENLSAFSKQSQLEILAAKHLLTSLQKQHKQVVVTSDQIMKLLGDVDISSHNLHAMIVRTIASATYLERWDKIIEYASHWRENFSHKEVEIEAALANGHFRLQNFETAIDILEQLMAETKLQGLNAPDYWATLLGTSYFANGDTESALRWFEEAVIISPTELNIKNLEQTKKMIGTYEGKPIIVSN
ncbi:M56 family metallopeptidase [Agaribacter marinus]|uniref:Peptidase M56 domain-containing protein n=1 Tax=Agaribacter marinus TaxID=1431249 RepID=A0AA37SYP5_9ALTE|nr:M56 family metallopeptidase [Agaribacter marinus]GLR72597.1 hypothetical protein GCM10007852_35050 [Agaribacter marinus]